MCGTVSCNLCGLFCHLFKCLELVLSSNVLFFDQTVSNDVAVALAVTVTVLVPVDLTVAVGLIGFGVTIRTDQEI